MAGSVTETGSEVVRRRLEGGVFVSDKREDPIPSPLPRCDLECDALGSLFDAIPWISLDREGCLKEGSVPMSVKELDEPPDDRRKTKLLLLLLLLLPFEGDGGLLLERFEGDPGEEDTGDW